MIYFKLFWAFLKIGLFTFGGGYAMVSLIENEVVERQQWLTAEEFTDILAVSQMTPGPIGINTATYVGYTATAQAGCGTWASVGGAVLASFAVILLPVTLMLLVVQFLMRHRGNRDVESVFAALRITAIGLIAAAALSLFNVESFGNFGWNSRFVASCAIFAVVFLLSLVPRKGLGKGKLRLPKLSPIVLILASGLAGFLIYGL